MGDTVRCTSTTTARSHSPIVNPKLGGGGCQINTPSISLTSNFCHGNQLDTAWLHLIESTKETQYMC